MEEEGGRRGKSQCLENGVQVRECKGAGKTVGKLLPTSGPRRARGPGRRARPLLSPAASGLLGTAASCGLGGMRAGVLPGIPCIHAPPGPARPSSDAEPGPRGLSREQVREQGGDLGQLLSPPPRPPQTFTKQRVRPHQSALIIVGWAAGGGRGPGPAGPLGRRGARGAGAESCGGRREQVKRNLRKMDESGGRHPQPARPPPPSL